MKRVVTQEWEFAKTFIFDFVLRSGTTKLEWDDFYAFAEKHHPLVAVIVEDNMPLYQLAELAISEIQKYALDNLSCIIISICYKEGESITIDEISAFAERINSIAENEVQIQWSVSPNNQINSDRSIGIYIFENDTIK